MRHLSSRRPLAVALAMRSALLSGFLLLAAMPAASQAPGAFARFGMGARAAVLGPQAGDAFGDTSPYHNPALGPFQASQGMEITGALLDFDREWTAVQVGAPLQPRAGLAGGFVQARVTGIDGRDESGYSTGEFDVSEQAFFVAFGTRLSSKVAAGVGLRVYRSDLAEEIRPPTALGFSLGLAAKPSDRFSFGLVAEDLFAQYNWNASAVGGGTVADRFPVRLRGGAAYRLGGTPEDGGLLLAAEFEGQIRSAETREAGGIGTIGGIPTAETVETDLRLGETLARVGAEYELVDAFAVRAGVDRLLLGDAGEIRPSAGFSVSPRLGELDIRIDYAATLESYGTGIAQTATLRVEL